MREIADFFEREVLEHFDFLRSEIGYRHTATKTQPPEVWVTFESSATAVVITLEVGSEPWVELARLHREGSEIIRAERTSLELLLRERAPGESGPEAHVNPASTELEDVSDTRLRQILKQKADALRRHGSDLLRGDFSIMPRLKHLEAENEREAERRLFGSNVQVRR